MTIDIYNCACNFGLFVIALYWTVGPFARMTSLDIWANKEIGQIQELKDQFVLKGQIKIFNGKFLICLYVEGESLISCLSDMVELGKIS